MIKPPVFQSLKGRAPRFQAEGPAGEKQEARIISGRPQKSSYHDLAPVVSSPPEINPSAQAYPVLALLQIARINETAVGRVYLYGQSLWGIEQRAAGNWRACYPGMGNRAYFLNIKGLQALVMVMAGVPTVTVGLEVSGVQSAPTEGEDVSGDGVVTVGLQLSTHPG